MALDEQRTSFPVTRIDRGHEVWFRGVHSDVGGGNGNAGLHDITLRWMFRKAKAAGLPINDADIAVANAGANSDTRIDQHFFGPDRQVRGRDLIHYSVDRSLVLDGARKHVPPVCPGETEADELLAQSVAEIVAAEGGGG